MKTVRVGLLCGALAVLAAVAGADTAQGTSARPNPYEVAGISSPAAAERFFHRLQRAVARERRAEVAAMVDYPVSVRLRGRTRRIRNRAELLRQYPLVFNRKVRGALSRQKTAGLFVNWRGVMVGNGELWFNEQAPGGRFGIIAINN